MARRRIVRPTPLPVLATNPLRTQRLQQRLETARRGFQRWMVRLKRACNAVAKQQSQIARLEKLIHKQEES